MKILVIGASQGTGALAVKKALDRGHEVTAFARSPEKLDASSPKLTRKKGDFHDAASVDGAIPGHDAVIVTASATSFKTLRADTTYFSRGTRFVIDSMKKHGVKKLVILSALGTGESKQLMNFIERKLIVEFILKTPFADHERQEAMAKESGLDYVIARPGRLTNGAAKGRYVKKTGSDPVPKIISRADVADFLVQACEVETWNGEAVQIGG